MAVSGTERIALARALGAIANPVRLSILEALRTPRTLREIDVRPAPGDPFGSPDRPLARQTVKEHLDRLVEIDLVLSRRTARERGGALEYVVNHQTLFALGEDLRELARLRPAEELAALTRPGDPPRESFRLQAPALAVVKGLEEGRSFSLDLGAASHRRWIVGRNRGADVPLDFDPFVSGENTVIEWKDGTYFVVDLPESRNGTTLNFDLLPKGERRRVENGDVIGVGRCFLLFRA